MRGHLASAKELLGRTQSVQAALQAVEALVNLAFTDATTGLANRRALDEIARTVSGFDGPQFTVVLLDLSGFKRINDEGSHAAGDSALATVGKTMLQMASELDEGQLIPFRYGGDEFCILVPEQSFELFLTNNLSKFRWDDFTYNGRKLPFATSIGIARADGEASLQLLIERADVATKASKLRHDEPVVWRGDLEADSMISVRHKCNSCVATVNILAPRKKLPGATAITCPLCQGVLGTSGTDPA